MKTIIITFAVIFALVATPSYATGKPVAVKVLSTKRYVFYYKVEKEIVGGTVQVFDASQKLISTETIVHIKNIVDFFELKPGVYTIKIKKDNQEFVFEYVNIK